MEAISVKNLSVAYEDNLIIDDMNLSIPKGKISIIIGANGCGKSTLLKTIARVIKPKNGDIFINGKDIKIQKEKYIATQVAFLPQGPVCPSGITVKELVAFGRFPHQKLIGGLKAHDKEIIDWAIEETGLTDFADREIENLSGGQRQRAWIALSLAQDTDIILLDEPTNHLDIKYQLEILNILRNLNEKENRTIAMVIHDINHALKYADNIVAIKNGNILAQGPKDEIINEKLIKDVFDVECTLINSPIDNCKLCVPFI